VDDPQAKQEGLALVEGVLAENPNSVSGLLTLAKALLMDRHYEDAAGKIQRVLDEQPSSRGHLLLGWAYIGMGQHELARSELLRAIQLDPDNHVAGMELAGLYLRTGQHELAAQEAGRVLAGRPGTPRMVLVLAQAKLAGGSKDEALGALESLELEGRADTRDHRLAAGRLYRRLDQPDQALPHLEAALAMSPGDPDVLRELVALDIQARDPQRALGRLDAAIEENPDSGAAYALRGAVYLGFREEDGTRRYAEEAERDLKTAIEKDPSRLEAYSLLAALYRATKRTDEAIRTFEEARDARPDSASMHLVLGTLYEHEGRVEDAIREYEEVVRRDPKQAIAKNNLAWLLAEFRSDSPDQLDRALALAQDARELMPDDPNVADTLGWVMLRGDNPRAAIPLFEEAIAGYDPGDVNRAVVRYHLAQAYASSGDVRRAITEAERALEESAQFPKRNEAEVFLAKLRAS
jgi:tetratricopeptide (TPR) repeat protein